MSLNDYRYAGGWFKVPFETITFTGADVKDFLQNQSTYDITLLTDKCFHLVSFLDPQGRVECYGWIVKNKSYFFLIPPRLKERAIERLNRFLISEDVAISEPKLQDWSFVVGPESEKIAPVARGMIFDEDAALVESAGDLPQISSAEVKCWGDLSGSPSFDGSDFSPEIINNLRLFDLSVTLNKGCYPGQETVSKIATRRGAAYAPVLIETDELVETGDLFSFDKKIGSGHACHPWQGKFYLSAQLLRDFRVEGMKVEFKAGAKSHEGIVRYYPLLSGDKKAKAKELFFEGSDLFREDKLTEAEERFKLAIKIDPAFADAYESLGVMLGRQNRYEEALEWMKHLSEVDPRSVLAHTNMSLFLMKLGRIEEAEEHKSLATVKSFQSFGDEAKQKEAQAERKKKQEQEWNERESMFLQVLQIDPEDTLANFGLGSIAVERKNWQKAREHLERVLKEDPKYSVAYLALGRALKGLGLVSEAKAVWSEGIKVAAAKGDLMPANQMQQELNS
jgi:tetratricopeptide (TPR) repeat protein